MLSPVVVGIAAFFFVAAAGGVVAYLLYYFHERSVRKRSAVPDPEPAAEEIDPSAGYEFMVHESEGGRTDENGRVRSYDLYSPESTKVIDYLSEDDGYFRGHNVKITELPEPKEEKVDASWVELDVTREFKEIIKEIKRRKLNCYEILNVPENAKPEEIRKAYRKAASFYHPDRGPGAAGLDKDQVEEIIREINYSKDMLLNPTMRSFHDQILRDRRREN
ncbi:MAG: J domain-containing protein [Thermoplasmatota archaeon]